VAARNRPASARARSGRAVARRPQAGVALGLRGERARTAVLCRSRLRAGRRPPGRAAVRGAGDPSPSCGCRRRNVTTAVDPYSLELDERAPRGLTEAAPELSDVLARAEVPGATLLVVDADGPILRAYGGSSCIVGEQIPTARDTIYDVASLTKVVATTTLVLAFAERGLWSIDAAVSNVLPDFPRDDVSLEQLLTHTSGLVPHREFYRLGRGVSEIAPLVYGEARDLSPGSVDYSDLNFMLLGWALEAVTGTPLD